MEEGGTTSSSVRPKEVSIAGWLVLLESIVGAISGGVAYYISEEYGYGGNDLALLGIVLAFVGFWLYFQILGQDYSAWNMAVIFNILAIFLYATGENWAGVVLSLICLLYLVQPNVKQYFVK
jgi:hypothetical protein